MATTVASVVTEAVKDVVETTTNAVLNNGTTTLAPANEIVKDLEEAIIDRFTELFVMYKPWIMGIGIGSTVFFCFIFFTLLLILIILMCQGGGSINMTLRKMVNKNKLNYSLLKPERDEDDEFV